MKNQKNSSNAPKMHPTAKLPITDTPKVWICGSPYVDGNAKLVSTIMKNQKNGSNTPKMHPRAKFPITDPSKVWVCGSPYGDRNAKLVSAIMKIRKMALTPQKCILEQNSQLSTSLKFGSVVLHMLTEMKNWCRPL